MLQPFKKDAIKTHNKIIQIADIAAFESGTVHNVYSTFSLTRDAEWCGRLFVLDMLEPHEQGIGTSISVQHISPAFVDDQVIFTGKFIEITERLEIITSFEAHVNSRLIAKGIQGQKILSKQKIEQIFTQARLQ